MGLVFLEPGSWASTAQVVIYAIGLAVICWQLWQMKKYGQRRDREIDAMAARLRETNRKLRESTREMEAKLTESTHRLGQQLAQQRQAHPHPSD